MNLHKFSVYLLNISNLYFCNLFAYAFDTLIISFHFKEMSYKFSSVLGARFDDGAGGDNEVQRTMLELINQLDGFDPRGNIKVLMATNRPDILDPALMRPGRLDRKIEFGLPDLEVI